MDKDKQLAEFAAWLETQPLGPLEDVRPFVEAVAAENGADYWKEGRAAEVAKQTVLSMLDDAQYGAELMAGYRHK